ncbi:C2 calcium-dependent membrane targeting [Macleaya cordata]|uniref:phospholipase D n=1 Tax=Macleaya cordata TaxID=56857 RepID=A0A200PPL7_MACCD|nr:C2 calcium-dependent membrane targeting [Macleaya cordata]
MENHGSSYPYGDPYRYPPPPRQQQPQPQSHPPPPNSDPYAPYPSLPNYPYHTSNSYPYPYHHHQPPPPPVYPNHSGPLDYQYPYPATPYYAPQPNPNPQIPHPYPYPYPNPNPNLAPPPPPPATVPQISHQSSLQHHSSFHYGSTNNSSSNNSPPPPAHANSFSGYERQDSSVSVSGGSLPNKDSSAGYPPLDDVLGNLHLSDQHSSAPQLPPAQPFLSSTPSLQSHSAKYDNRFDMYSYPNNSFSSNVDPSYPHPTDSPHPVYGSSSSFNSRSHHNQNLQLVPSALQMVPASPRKGGSLKVLLLHGNLDIWVYDARNLPNMDMFHKKFIDVFGSLPVKAACKMEGQMNHKITSDPYVSISISNAVIGRTFVISNSENPNWLQHFCVPVAHYAAEVHFVVKDSDVVGSQLIGTVPIPVEQIYLGAKVEGCFPILNSSGKPCKPGAQLRLSIQYTPIEKLTVYNNGVGAGPDYYGVQGTYFPLRKGGKVTLYQDAHVPDGSLPSLKLDHEMHYDHGKCWHDIMESISQARRLIYITGWSVYHKVRLVRDAGYASDFTLGDLIKSKSQEGVRVLLLIWDDPTSRNILGYNTDGLMATHDEETRRFFKHSSVQVLLCPRSAGKRHSWAKQQEVGTIYTHHQKTVIVDADAGKNRRKIIAFVGGLDLCDGRYDTPKHFLFKTLNTLHKDDYHNPTFTGPTAGCPREPWHDMHSKIDGPAAYDILTNFEERWSKASKRHGIKKLKKSSDDALLRIERIPDIVGMLEAPCLSDDDPETWHVQIFRSIDSNSVKAFPKDPKDATSKNLVCGKNVLIDMSIHTAYVKAIRAAQHFIYIENQYFLGSSYNWAQYRDLGANNLIPMEIALKIANKIRANERFAAYIVVPMWPEGVPTGAATQRILFWQHKTMQMMYETIYKALEEVGLESVAHPQDYLNFFCLGNREAPDGSDASFGGSPTASNTPQAFARKSRRFMIYVHSKGMIVDDEYVILGSANINQRSMEGTRDTEIAMGAYQPQHTWAKKQSSPHGQIYGYRMSLWAEHIGVLEDCFTEPESLECVRRVRWLGEYNWKQFAADEVTEMRGHLLKYPVEVDLKGKVKPIPGCETFPDVGGNIVGTFFAIQENLTI